MIKDRWFYPTAKEKPMPEKIQEPTVGRIVYYYDPHASVPLPAMVVAVREGMGLTIDVMMVFRHDGSEAVQFVDHVSDTAGMMPRWDWMQYQKGQAAKAEELEQVGKQMEDEIRRMVGVSPGPIPVQLTSDEERRVLAASTGKDADVGLNTLARTPKPE